MKKSITVLLTAIVISMMLIGCASSDNNQSIAETEKSSSDNNQSMAETEKTSGTAKSSGSLSSPSAQRTYTSFTNKYGTSTTKCAKAGCNNYIASSGDTAYCTVHSNRCLECNKYIDGDAMYCMDCLTKAVNDTSDDKTPSYNGGSYSSGGSHYSGYNNNAEGYGYDSSDPYYSANDHNGDGKINDQEFQDAMNDLIDDLLAAQD